VTPKGWTSETEAILAKIAREKPTTKKKTRSEVPDPGL